MATSPTHPHSAEGAASDRTVRQLIDEWRSADLISQEQATAIETYHREHHAVEERSRGFRRMVAVASTLGAVLVGGGILLIVGSNWASYDRIVQTLLAISVFVLLEVAGYLMRYRTAYHKTGEALLFVGAVAYGGAIFLVAQVYNRPLDDPNLFVFWLIPVLPLAYAVRSRIIAALAILVTFGVVAYRMDDWLRDVGPVELAIPTTYLMLGAATFVIGGLHRDIPQVRTLAPPWEWLGVATVVVMTFVASFRALLTYGGGGWLGDVGAGLLTVLVVCGIVVAGGIVARTAIRGRFDTDVALMTVIAGCAIAACAVLIATGSMAELASYALMNLILLGLIVAMVVGGIVTDRQSLVNIALVIFAVAVFARYLEIGAGMLGTGASMVLGGVLLIGLGVGLERARRSIVARMHAGEVAR